MSFSCTANIEAPSSWNFSFEYKSSKMKVGILKRVRNFIDDFFNQSVIHGFSYLGSHLTIHVFEKLFWFSIICTAIYFCVDCSLVSWDRYLHKSTVVSVQVDFYFWNSSLPSLTICPMDRLDPERFEAYATWVEETGLFRAYFELLGERVWQLKNATKFFHFWSRSPTQPTWTFKISKAQTTPTRFWRKWGSNQLITWNWSMTWPKTGL